jgi:uncharacterized protein (DUF2236 family)
MTHVTARADDRLRAAPDPGPATTDSPQLFGPGSHMWDGMGDVLFLALTPAAFMLQAMHPTIAAAVDRHSVFRTDPGGRAVRSLDSMMLWVYGGAAAIEEGERLRVLHRPIHGTDDGGERYSALDPEAYAWVHGTAFVTAMTIHPLLHGREATPSEQEEMYEEHLQLGAILRVPAREMPETIPEYWDYYRTMVTDRLARTTVAEDVLRLVTAPPVRVLPGPVDLLGAALSRTLGQAQRLLMLGGMRRDARDVLGERFSTTDRIALESLMTVARPVHARLPEQLRYAPLALHARRHARELAAMRERSTKSVA